LTFIQAYLEVAANIIGYVTGPPLYIEDAIRCCATYRGIDTHDVVDVGVVVVPVSYYAVSQRCGRKADVSACRGVGGEL